MLMEHKGFPSLDGEGIKGRVSINPHPRIKYGAGSNPLPSKGRGRIYFLITRSLRIHTTLI